MATELSFISARQITNDSGVVQSGALVYFYRENTTTNLTVWDSDAADSAHAQPVVCDSGGFVPLVYVDDTYDYKIVIQTAAGVTLQTYDEIPKAVDTTSGTTDFAKFLMEWTVVTDSTLSPDTSDSGKGYQCNTGSNNITVTLPSAIAVGNGKGFAFKKTSASNTLTINAATSPSQQTIDGRNLVTLYQLNDLAYCISDGADWQILSNSDYLQRLPKLYRSGCILSNDTDADHDINVTAGSWRDIDDTYDIVLTSEITKQIDAVWASGDDAGGLDTGTVTTSTTYHVFVIANPTSGAVDVLFSTSLASPTMPSGYTKKRRVGSVVTDSSSNILPFVQHGDLFYWDSPQYSIYSSTGTATTRTHVLDVPTGIRLECVVNLFVDNASQIYAFPTDVTATTPSSTASPLITAEHGGGAYGRQVQLLTDTSAQINFQTNTNTNARFAVVSFKDAFIT